jgi:cold shock CspA family protein
MGRSQETFNKKEVRNKKAKKRKEKEQRRLAKKENSSKNSLDDMIAYVDENGNITDTPPDPDKKTEVSAEEIVLGANNRNTGEEEDDLPRTGIVTYFDDSKGFGFIKDSNTKESIFVHINNAHDDLRVDNLVSYEVAQGPKGPTAMEVKLVK